METGEEIVTEPWHIRSNYNELISKLESNYKSNCRENLIDYVPLFTDQSLVHPNRKMSDFKVCTQNYTVENTPKWSVGHTDEWQYKTLDEEDAQSES